MADISSPRPAYDVFDELARLHAVMLAEAALANESAAREQNGASLFSDIERRLLRRLVQADEESAPPSRDEFNQLFQLFERAAERPYVPFPGMPRLKQMLALIEAANAEANDDAPLPAESGWQGAGGPMHGVGISSEASPAAQSDAPPVAEYRQMPVRHRSRDSLLENQRTGTVAPSLSANTSAAEPLAVVDVDRRQPRFRRRSRPTREPPACDKGC